MRTIILTSRDGRAFSGPEAASLRDITAVLLRQVGAPSGGLFATLDGEPVRIALKVTGNAPARRSHPHWEACGLGGAELPLAIDLGEDRIAEPPMAVADVGREFLEAIAARPRANGRDRILAAAYEAGLAAST